MLRTVFDATSERAKTVIRNTASLRRTLFKIVAIQPAHWYNMNLT